MSTYSVLGLTLSSLIAISTNAAETNDYYDESDLLVDIPMVSSGGRMEQKPHYSPSSVTVINSGNDHRPSAQ